MARGTGTLRSTIRISITRLKPDPVTISHVEPEAINDKNLDYEIETTCCDTIS